jgi:hypothetical protein
MQVLEASQEATLIPLRDYDHTFGQKKMIMSKTFPDTVMFETQEDSTCCCRVFGNTHPLTCAVFLYDNVGKPILDRIGFKQCTSLAETAHKASASVSKLSNAVGDASGLADFGGGGGPSLGTPGEKMKLRDIIGPPHYHTMKLPNKDMRGNDAFSISRDWHCTFFCCGPCKTRTYMDVKDAQGSFLGKIEQQDGPFCCSCCKEYVALSITDGQGNEKYTLRHEKADCCKCDGCKGKKGCPCLNCCKQCCSCCDFKPIDYEMRFRIYGPREKPCSEGYVAEVAKKGMAFMDLGSPTLSPDYKTSISFASPDINDKILMLGLLEYIDTYEYKIQGAVPSFNTGSHAEKM